MDTQKPSPHSETQPGGSNKGGDPGDPSELWRLLGAGIQLAATVLLFVGVGWWLDRRNDWSPWGVTGLGMIGVAAGLYHFLKDVSR